MLVLFRDRRGRIGHVEVGSAFTDANWDGAVWLPHESWNFCGLFCDSPYRAREALRELEELGEEDPDPEDFKPRWHSPAAGVAALDEMLSLRGRSRRKGARRLTRAVCDELGRLRILLERAGERGLRFHLVELWAHESRDFAGPVCAWADGA